jgi:hypothetical protein
MHWQIHHVNHQSFSAKEVKGKSGDLGDQSHIASDHLQQQ